MHHASIATRYRTEADYALERLKKHYAEGDPAGVDHWHRAWSTAEAAAEAELLQHGGGRRVLRRASPPTLRPLPPEVTALAQATLPAPPREPPRSEPAVHASPVGDNEPSALAKAIERHDLIERALRDGAANPLAGELTDEEWSEHLTAFLEGGPLECELLQEAEAAVEALVEMDPSAWDSAEDPDDEGLADLSVSLHPERDARLIEDCLRIYSESLPELTEEQLRADLVMATDAGRPDTARLIEAELVRRERETAPDTASLYQSGTLPHPDRPQRPEPPASEQAPSDVPRDSIVAEHPKRARSTPRVANKVPETERRERSGPRRLPAAEGVDGASPRTTSCSTAPAWIDTAGRTRTWALFDTAGERIAEITTKRDAERLAQFLTGLIRTNARLLAVHAPVAPAPERVPRED